MEALLESLYSCVADSRNWNVFCDDLAHYYKSNSVEIFSINEKTEHCHYASTSGLSENSKNLLLSYLPNNDPRLSISKAQPSTSHIFDIKSSKSSLSNSNIAHEIFSPNKIHHHLVTCLKINPNEYAYIVICRKNKNDGFESKDIESLNIIKEHISRSIKIQNKYAINDKFIRASLNNFKQNITGSIIINANNDVFHLNEYAKTIINNQDGLLIINNVLYCGNLKKYQHLSTLVDLTNLLGEETRIHLPRINASSDLQIKVAPFNTRFSPFQPEHLNSNMVQISIIDPDKKIGVTTPLLENVFGLTVSEAKVAAALSHSCNMQKTQNTLNISANTAKSHLKSIFNKMNVSSQVELVKLITTSHYW